MVARVLLDIANKKEGCELFQVELASGPVSVNKCDLYWIIFRVLLPYYFSAQNMGRLTSRPLIFRSHCGSPYRFFVTVLNCD